MPKEIRIPFTQLRIGRFLFLLISILLMFILRPFLEGFVGVSLLVDIFVSVVLLSGIYAVSQKKNVFYISLIIAAPALILSWARYFVTVSSFFLVGKIFAAVFYIFMVFIILNYLFNEKEITSDVIIGAICVYLLIGLMWASFFTILESVQPGSFKIPEGLGVGLSHFSYYSFVTITTLGYGDITPITAPARSLSLLAAIMGQLYLAILLARLVGIHISQSMQRK